MEAGPIKGELVAELARGVTLRLPAEGNREWVIAHLRAGDRVEYEAFKRESGELKAPESRHSLAVWVKDDLVGLWSSNTLFGETPKSPRRGWGWITTEASEKHWLTFGIMTKAVFKEVWKHEDPWVTESRTVPWAGYTRTMNWQERMLGSETVREIVIGGKLHLVTVFKRP